MRNTVPSAIGPAVVTTVATLGASELASRPPSDTASRTRCVSVTRAPLSRFRPHHAGAEQADGVRHAAMGADAYQALEALEALQALEDDRDGLRVGVRPGVSALTAPFRVVRLEIQSSFPDPANHACARSWCARVGSSSAMRAFTSGRNALTRTHRSGCLLPPTSLRTHGG